MKVLQINSVCGYGSTGRIVTDIYKVLESQGHECLVAFGRGIAPEGINSIKIGTNFDNYIHVSKTRLLDMHGFSSTKATKEFIDKAKEYDPDIIHLHNIHGYYINIELLFNYLKEANKPVVWTLHDCWALTGHCAYFDYVGCDRWKSGCYDCPQKHSYPASKFIDNTKNNYQKKKELFTGVKNLTIVTVSKWLAGIVKQSILNEYPTIVIENGIDLSVFKPTKSDIRKEYNIENKSILLGVASDWEDRKGLRYFTELSNLLKDNQVIILVGLNQSQIKNLPKNIIGIPRTNNLQELTEIYSAADVFLNLSVEETMGLTTVEALACGTPAIVFDATALPEVINSDCGFVIEKGNVIELYEIISTLSKSYIKEEKCIERAKLYEKYEKYSKYIDLYNLNNRITN